MTEYRVYINPPETHDLEVIGDDIEADNPREAQAKALKQQDKYPRNEESIMKYAVVAVPESYVTRNIWSWNLDAGGWHL